MADHKARPAEHRGSEGAAAAGAGEDPRDARLRELEAVVERLQEELEGLRPRAQPEVEPIAKEVRRRFTNFVVNQLNPGFQERYWGDLSSWTPGVFQEAGQVGLIGFGAPKPVGGEGRDPFAVGIFLEELGKLVEDPGFLMFTQINCNWATFMAGQGREDLIERYAKPILRGERLLAWALWEPADLSFMGSVAKKVDGGWVLSGQKSMITGGEYASVFVVGVRDDASGDTVMFLVDLQDPGVRRERVHTVGARSGGFCTLTLDQVQLPDDRLLIDTDAMASLSPIFNHGIMNASAIFLGWMQKTLAACIESLRPKVRAGQCVLDIPHVQQEMGRLQIGVEAARAMFLAGLEKFRRGKADPASEPLALALKHFVTDRAIDMGQTLLTLQGAAGYMDENPWGRFLTEVLCLVHAGGAQDILPMRYGTRFLAELELKKLRKFTF